MSESGVLNMKYTRRNKMILHQPVSRANYANKGDITLSHTINVNKDIPTDHYKIESQTLLEFQGTL